MAKHSRVGLAPPKGNLNFVSVGQAPPYMTFSLLALLMFVFSALADGAAPALRQPA